MDHILFICSSEDGHLGCFHREVFSRTIWTGRSPAEILYWLPFHGPQGHMCSDACPLPPCSSQPVPTFASLRFQLSCAPLRNAHRPPTPRITAPGNQCLPVQPLPSCNLCSHFLLGKMGLPHRIVVQQDEFIHMEHSGLRLACSECKMSPAAIVTTITTDHISVV